MKVLLDTCVVIWATVLPKAVSRKARETILDTRNTIFVSAVSAWEIATKVRLGKLPQAERLELEYVETMSIAGYTMLAIDTECALRAGRLLGRHRDPFDRILAAQALALDIPILSPDTQLDQFGVRRIW
jgi:PIN domain nuclease of toxin-antitoxin system